MPDQSEFVNLYIIKLTDEVTDLTKQRLVAETKLDFNDRIIEELKKIIQQKDAEFGAAQDVANSVVRDRDEHKQFVEQRDRELKDKSREIESMRHEAVAFRDEIKR